MAKEKEPQAGERTGRQIEGETRTTDVALHQAYETSTFAITRKRGTVTRRQVNRWVEAARAACIGSSELRRQIELWEHGDGAQERKEIPEELLDLLRTAIGDAGSVEDTPNMRTYRAATDAITRQVGAVSADQIDAWMAAARAANIAPNVIEAQVRAWTRKNISEPLRLRMASLLANVDDDVPERGETPPRYGITERRPSED